MPYFVDVKAHGMENKRGEPNYFLQDREEPAILFSTFQYSKLDKFQSLVRIPVWICLFERAAGSNIRKQRMYMAPLSVIGRFYSPSHWKFLQIPLSCWKEINLGEKQSLVYNIPETHIDQFVQLLHEDLDRKHKE